MMVKRQKTTAESLLSFGTILGFILMASASGWVVVVRDREPHWFYSPFLIDIFVGLFAGWAAGWLVWVYGARLPGTIEIRERLRATFDFAQFRGYHIAALALVAAVPEEVFFRGALQAEIGLLLTALIFGALHGLTPLYFVYATVAGLCLGLMAEWRGTLWLPIAAHFAIDYVSLKTLAEWVRSLEPSYDELHVPLFAADGHD